MLNLNLPLSGVGRSSLGTEAISRLSQLCLHEACSHKDVCTIERQGWVSQNVTEDCVEFWEGGALEDADRVAPHGLCKCQGIDLCGHSLKLRLG